MRTHQLNVTHLTLGLILIGVSALWGANAAGWTDFGDSAYLFPVLLIGAGLIGLVAFTLRGTRRPDSPDSPDHPNASSYPEDLS